MPVEFVVGPFEVSYSAFSAILLRRGVPVGVVYAGNNVQLSRSGPMTDSNSMWMVQLWSNFEDDGARPVSYLQLVSPVTRTACGWCNHLKMMVKGYTGSKVD